ncbi:phosphoenolpyruvate--protein phosphotransferase [uncultured Sphingomonas sp.]|uniref:phosphoenolpyruvate--protein phosphotransferase n=1 Tax=uncultured Sphingomonas sp. TaxID=158754 RepID=UPI00261A26E9|nr:phosphoenolpyruvate--protein phosphotransferase [uncultured Sphingomonas sp.]
MNAVVLHAPCAGWLAALDEVPDPVFAGRMMGAGLAIDPVEGALRAPADGRVIAVPASGHAVTLALDNGVELLIHIGLETVALAGSGFTPRVAPGDQVRAGELLIAFDLDAVARAAKDMITPLVAASDGAVVRIDRPGRRVAAGDPVATVTGPARPDDPGISAARFSRAIPIVAPHGIHARPAARIVALLKPYVASVTIEHGERSANARSTVALLGLGARRGDTVTAHAAGPDGAAALAALAAFAERHFGDDAADDNQPPAPRVDAGADGQGVTASPGLAIGVAVQLRAPDPDLPRDGAGAVAENAALDIALAATAGAIGGKGVAAAIADAHRALLEDPELRAAAAAQIAEGRSAAFAWRAALTGAADAIRATGDPLLIERVADLKDLERQVIAHLIGQPQPALPDLPRHAILIAEDLLPSQFLALDGSRLAGICTAAGGPTAHVAILAAAAGVPMVVAAGPDILAIPDGRSVILDADAGRIDPQPGIAALAEAGERIAAARALRSAALKAAGDICRMADGTRIEIFANLGSAEEAAGAVAAGAEGCGLLRTEFLFLDRDTPPGEDEQRTLYSRIATTLGDRPLVVRTLDIGGDKPVPYLPQAHEENPALGLRGVRLGLARPDMLATQLRAILAGVPGDQCRIMLPMIVDRDELRAVRHMLAQAMAAVGRENPVQLGVMIETPAAALLADQIAAEADFLSIGTNDLTQYALACDRGNGAVSAKVDALHPAVLRLIAQAAAGGQAHGRWVGLCGGLASDPLAAPLLIGLGVTELSATVGAIPALKAAVRALDMAICRALAARALDAASPAAVRALLAEARA